MGFNMSWLLCIFVAVFIGPLNTVTAADFLKCPTGWKMYYDGGSCMKYFSKLSNYGDARSTCKKARGDLIKLDNAKKNTFFISDVLPKNKNVYIGLHRNMPFGNIFRWLDAQTPATFTNWNNGEPNNWIGDEDCVAVMGNTRGKWNDVQCLSLQGFVCERKLKQSAGRNCLYQYKSYSDGQEWRCNDCKNWLQCNDGRVTKYRIGCPLNSRCAWGKCICNPNYATAATRRSGMLEKCKSTKCNMDGILRQNGYYQLSWDCRIKSQCESGEVKRVSYRCPANLKCNKGTCEYKTGSWRHTWNK